MKVFRYLTVPGVTEGTDLNALKELSGLYPFVEWQVCYDPARAGEEPQYPTLDWLATFAEFAKSNGLHSCVRLEGSAVSDALSAYSAKDDGTTIFAESVTPHQRALDELFDYVGRIKLETTFSLDQVPALEVLRLHCRNDVRHQPALVLPWNQDNFEACEAFGYRTYDVNMLISETAPRSGVLNWPAPDPRQIYQHGCVVELTPENLESTWNELSQRMYEDQWLWLELPQPTESVDLDAVESLLQAIEDLLERQATFHDGDPFKRPVSRLDGFWLEWWASKTLGLDLAPVVSASRMILTHDREHGHYGTVTSWREEEAYMRIFGREQIAFMPDAYGAWHARFFDGSGLDAPLMPGPTLLVAGMRALVAKHFGKSVPEAFELRRN